MLNAIMLCLALVSSNHQSLGRHKYEKPYKAKYTVTAYATGEPGVGHITYTGHRVHLGVVAVDPKVIPLGSHVYIPRYGWFIADDIGGKIKGRHIDMYVASRHQAGRFGRQKWIIGVYPKGIDVNNYLSYLRTRQHR